MDRRDRFFRGFINIYGKKPLQKFRDVPAEELLDEATADSRGDYAGVLASDIVCVDFDDSDSAEKALEIVRDTGTKTTVYKTDRGMHFLFRNTRNLHSSTGSILACTLTADIKSGDKNSYIVRKKDGKIRKILIYSDDLDDFPTYFIPIHSRKLSEAVGMEDGDGRNNAIFTGILSLQNEGLRKDEIREILSVVNHHIFAEPISENEFETATRDEAFDKPKFFEKGKFLFDEFARYLIGDKSIVSMNGKLFIYDGKAYVPSKKLMERTMIGEISRLSRSQREETLSYMELISGGKTMRTDPRYICFTNGIYDIDSDRMLSFSSDIPVTNPIPHPYVKDAYSELGDRTLDMLSDNDEEIRMILEETIGYVFFRRQELRKSFLMVGGKRGGKSTFLDIILTIVGNENSCSLDLAELSDRFKTAELADKLVCIGDDINDDFIEDTSVFKKVVSGDRLNAERKGKDPFDFAPYCKLFFSANSLPRMKDRNGAVLDRMIIIPFLHEFGNSKEDYDPFIKYKLREEECIEYFISLGIQGLRRILATNAFTHSSKVDAALAEYEKDNNSVIAWLKDENPAVVDAEVSKVYNTYRSYCYSEGLQPLSGIEVGKQLRRLFKLETKVTSIKGKSVRIYRGR